MIKLNTQPVNLYIWKKMKTSLIQHNNPLTIVFDSHGLTYLLYLTANTFRSQSHVAIVSFTRVAVLTKEHEQHVC